MVCGAFLRNSESFRYFCGFLRVFGFFRRNAVETWRQALLWQFQKVARDCTELHGIARNSGELHGMHGIAWNCTELGVILRSVVGVFRPFSPLWQPFSCILQPICALFSVVEHPFSANSRSRPEVPGLARPRTECTEFECFARNCTELHGIARNCTEFYPIFPGIFAEWSPAGTLGPDLRKNREISRKPSRIERKHTFRRVFLYCPKCPDLPRIARICTELHGLHGIEHIFPEMHGIARICTELHGIARNCTELHGISPTCPELPGIARNCP